MGTTLLKQLNREVLSCSSSGHSRNNESDVNQPFHYSHVFSPSLIIFNLMDH